MNLGIVGVGPWGRIVAAAFEKAGVTVAAHDRKDVNKGMVRDLGDLMPWRNMVESSSIDVVAAVASPEVTKQIFASCQAKGKPCFLTKPFEIEKAPRDMSAPAYVDYVQLASPVYEKFKKSATRDYKIESLKIEFHGNGPERSFPGVVDYGSHALAFAHDLLGLHELEKFKASSLLLVERGPRDLVEIEAEVKGIPVRIRTGNGSSGAKRRIEAQLARGPRLAYDELNRVATFEIDDKLAMRMPGHDPLSLMVERFLWDVDVGRVNPYFVELSAAITRSLKRIVEGS
jgi:predicted dehydrogenase